MNKQFDYFLKNVQLFYEIKDLSIGYGNEDNKIIISENAPSNFWNNKTDINNNEVVWKEWKGKQIPFLFEKYTDKEIISIIDSNIIINYDIVASAFYFLSGWNELVSSSKDEFGRVKFEDSIINSLNIIDIPVVNYYFDILNEAIKLTYNKDVKKNKWGDKDFAVTLTHDIDTCKSCWLEGSFSELKKMQPFSIPKILFNKIIGKDNWYNFDTILDIEKKYNAFSSFYFLPQQGKVGNWKNADYNISAKDIQQTILSLKENGCEVAVHGSFGTHDNSDNLKIDIERVGHKPIIGNRFRFLMYEPEKSVGVLEDCNIKYDTTIGFSEHIGFRRGICFPFYLWNFQKNEISSVIEFPLLVMDGSLANKKYMGISIDESLAKVSELIDEVRKFDGVFTVLWHNTYFSDYKYTGWRDVYDDILNYCNQKQGLISSTAKIYSKLIE